MHYPQQISAEIYITNNDVGRRHKQDMKSVILVDDDLSTLDVFKVMFERAGYAITVFNDPDPVLANKFEEPDVFIIDKQLRGVDGIDVCRFLKQRVPRRNTPVVIFSASTFVGRYAKDAGADAFIEKPFKTKDLFEIVERLTAIT